MTSIKQGAIHNNIGTYYENFWHNEPEQNGWYFAYDRFRCIFRNGIIVFFFKFHWSLFLMIQSTYRH